MIKMKRKPITDTGMVLPVIWGAAAGIIISCVGVLTGPILILNEYSPPYMLSTITTIIQLIAGMGGTLVAAALKKENKFIAISMCACVIYLTMMSVGILLFEAKFSSLLLGLAGYMGGAICSVIIINTQKKGSKKKRIKHRSR